MTQISSQKSKTSSRFFTKCVILFLIVCNNAAMFQALWLNPAQAADIITNSGAINVALAGLYMGVGHLDLRAFAAQGLLDVKRGSKTYA